MTPALLLGFILTPGGDFLFQSKHYPAGARALCEFNEKDDGNVRFLKKTPKMELFNIV